MERIQQHWQDYCKAAGEYGCLAMSYLFARNIPPLSAVHDYLQLVTRGIIDKNFKVLSARKLYKFYGIDCTVSKSTTPPTNPTEIYIAKYSFNGYGHWVVKKGDQIIFNGLSYSHCVTHGKPTDFRLLSH
jgi:hypothetical protein